MDMKLSVRVCMSTFTNTFTKIDFVWKAFNISQPTTTTFAMQVNLLTYHGKYILKWLIEVRILFFQYTKDKSSAFLQS